jgi:hypothetical protein
MGTASPGNSSGFLISRGKDIEIGKITVAKEMIENKKLNTISPLFFNHEINAQ